MQRTPQPSATTYAGSPAAAASAAPAAASEWLRVEACRACCAEILVPLSNEGEMLVQHVRAAGAVPMQNAISGELAFCCGAECKTALIAGNISEAAAAQQQQIAARSHGAHHSHKGQGHVSSTKAREILHHGEVHGHPLTERQRRFFGWQAGGGHD